MLPPTSLSLLLDASRDGELTHSGGIPFLPSQKAFSGRSTALDTKSSSFPRPPGASMTDPCSPLSSPTSTPWPFTLLSPAPGPPLWFPPPHHGFVPHLGLCPCWPLPLDIVPPPTPPPVNPSSFVGFRLHVISQPRPDAPGHTPGSTHHPRH